MVLKKKTHRLLGNLLLLFVVCGISVALGELAVRILKSNDLGPGLWPEDHAQFDPSLRKNLYPNIQGLSRTTSEYVYHVDTNTFGFRDFHSVEKKEGTFRIVAVGASTLFGNAVESDQRYLHRMEVELNQKLGEEVEQGKAFGGTDFSVEAINLGLGSNGFDEMKVILKEYGLRYQPDLILVEAELGSFYATHAYSLRSEIPQKKKTFLWLYEHSRLVNFVYWKIKTTPLGYQLVQRLGLNAKGQDGNNFDIALLTRKKDEAINRSLVSAYKNLEDMKLLAEEMKVPLVVIFLPSSPQIDPEEEEELRNLYLLDPAELDLSLAEKYIKRITALLEIPLFDPTERLKAHPLSKELHWRLDGHLTPEGNALYGGLLAEYLYQHHLVTQPKPVKEIVIAK